MVNYSLPGPDHGVFCKLCGIFVILGRLVHRNIHMKSDEYTELIYTQLKFESYR